MMPTNNNSGATKWTAEQDEVLTSLWREGKSATAIAVIMGGDLTRNSVIGRAHRLKLHETMPRPQRPRVAARRGDPRQHGNRGQVTAKGIVSRVAARREAANSNGGLAFKLSEARKQGLGKDEAMQFVLGRPGRLPPERDEGVDVSHLLGIMDLDQGAVLTQCRWPIGDPLEPGFGFCGRACQEGSSYCSTHHRRAYSCSTALI